MDSRLYRDLIGQFATGVTVVTTGHDGWLHGMTANAVCSVSLEPILLLVCVAKDAHCHRQITAAGHFGVNILSAEQEQVSNIFASRSEPERDQLRGVPYRLGPTGSPILEGSLAHLECRLYEQLPGGDHDIFVGEVLDGEAGDAAAAPLLFHRGRYAKLSPAS